MQACTLSVSTEKANADSSVKLCPIFQITLFTLHTEVWEQARRDKHYASANQQKNTHTYEYMYVQSPNPQFGPNVSKA